MDFFNLTGKTALVTGGNGGLGLGMAQGLANYGCEVILVGRNKKKLTDSVALINENHQGKAHQLLADVNLYEDLERIVYEGIKITGTIDILVNNAGISIRKQPQDLSDDDWDQVLNTNLKSVFRLSLIHI